MSRNKAIENDINSIDTTGEQVTKMKKMLSISIIFLISMYVQATDKTALTIENTVFLSNHLLQSICGKSTRMNRRLYSLRLRVIVPAKTIFFSRI